MVGVRIHISNCQSGKEKVKTAKVHGQWIRDGNLNMNSSLTSCACRWLQTEPRRHMCVAWVGLHTLFPRSVILRVSEEMKPSDNEHTKQPDLVSNTIHQQKEEVLWKKSDNDRSLVHTDTNKCLNKSTSEGENSNISCKTNSK